MKPFAPIVLFVYNRPVHTRKTLEALQLNRLAQDSILYIYADGPKESCSTEQLKDIQETREVIKEQQWCGAVHIIESEENKGLATSITEGVSSVVAQHGNIIVLEDDIVTSRGFLTYMNDALRFYKEQEEVMHISGYMYPHNSSLPETFFYNVTLCWGWATWDRAWNCYNDDAVHLWGEICKKDIFNALDKFGDRHLSKQLGFNITGKLDTWFVKWHASVLLHNGFTLFPGLSMVDNIGFDNSGVHNGSFDEFRNVQLKESLAVEQIEIKEHHNAGVIFKNFYKELHQPKKVKHTLSFKQKFKKGVRKILLKFLPEIRNNASNHHAPVLNNSFTGKHVKIYNKGRLNNAIVGDYSYISQNAMINHTVIGKFCSIGPNLVCGWGIHPLDGVSTHPMFYSENSQNGMTLSTTNKFQEVLPIVIGNDVFIGMNVTILDGVAIGNGAVIGAGAVVSKDIPAYAIAVGNPIRVIKYRFEQPKINQLLQSQWWDLKEDQLHLVEKNFFDIENLLNQLKHEI